MPAAGAAWGGGLLTIDLGAVAANYRALAARLNGADLAAVVKANAYGLGVDRVAPALAAAGCTTFCVAHIGEGIELRKVLRAAGIAADIHVMHGLAPGAENVWQEHALTPVLNSLADVDTWLEGPGGAADGPLADLHLDTGMSRLGLPAAEFEALTGDPARLEALRIDVILSHLACSEEPDNPMNGEQRAAFEAARPRVQARRSSLANSSGIFLGPEFHYDLARAGVAIYGVNPTPGAPNPMAQVVRLQGKILQIRDVDLSGTVGYGATHRASRRSRIATIAVGYADGYPWSLANKGIGYFGDVRIPIVGRVSMDLVTLDVTEVPEDDIRPGDLIDLIGPHNPVDNVAERAGTIGYEVLTRLGPRYERVYVEAETSAA